MRVIAGTAKGIRLAPVPRGVRPVSDMAREGLFSSLGEGVHGARVLDLYAGTGAMAIEALSRGAEHAVLVERDRTAIRAIRQNLDRTGLVGSVEVVVAEVGRFLAADLGRWGPIDLALVDPPYRTPAREVEGVLEALGRGWLAPGATVALTRPARSSTLVVPVDLAVTRRLGYGDTLVLIIREA